MEITTGDGETVTLGNLKDAWQDREAAKRESAERAAALDERETALIDSQRIWAEMGDHLTRALTPQQQQQLRENFVERERSERRAMVRAMPELQDETKLDQFRNDVAELLGSYGYKPHEVVIGDHRQLVVLRDMMRMKKRLDDLKSYKPKQIPPQKGKTNGRGTGVNARQASISKAKTGTEADKVAAVSQLLNGG